LVLRAREQIVLDDRESGCLEVSQWKLEDQLGLFPRPTWIKIQRTTSNHYWLDLSDSNSLRARVSKMEELSERDKIHSLNFY